MNDLVRGVLKRRSDITPLHRYMKKAKKVPVIGRTLKMVIGQSNFFLDLLNDDCELRFVTLNPHIVERPNILEAVLPESGGSDQAYDRAVKLFYAQLSSAIGHFENLWAAKKRGTILYRQIQFVSSISFVKVEDESGEGRIMVELMPYQAGEFERPHFEISSSDPDPRWYQFFSETCEEIWRRAVPVELGHGQAADRDSGTDQANVPEGS